MQAKNTDVQKGQRQERKASLVSEQCAGCNQVQFYSMAADTELRVLVLGGNGMMGSDFVLRFLASLDELKITGAVHLVLVSRGSEYWDDRERLEQQVALLETERPSAPRISIQRVILNRKYTRLLDGSQAAKIAELRSLGVFQFVVDFTSTCAHSLSLLLQALSGCFIYWLYISSDSVYEVCEPVASVDEHSSAGHQCNGLRESDAVRPQSTEQRAALAQRDSYAEQKLACEEVLQHYGVYYVALRLPDVLGARDNSERLLLYAIWIELVARLENRGGQRSTSFAFTDAWLQQVSGEHTGRVHIPAATRDVLLSFVWSEDVAKCLTEVIGKLMVEQLSCALLRSAFNLACSEQVTLMDFVGQIALALGIADFDQSWVSIREDAESFFPSVTKGPIAIARAQELLNFQPTPLATVVQEIVQFLRLNAFPSQAVPAPRFIAYFDTALESFASTFAPSSSSSSENDE